ncbi:hypothetical protein X777_14057 [Ooceraea biroi]|uniref:Uncharacterized protein n=1 Tax=Ooceraea biroi TaxID=2015173 RepID=A0A026VWQ9_OOCBI|nr:hypothetical protein X777_14057 [Ooceraea biroi]
MSGDADQVWTADRNQTAADFDLEGMGLGNITDELYPLPDYINVTLLPDVNITEAIDSFYFYEVSTGTFRLLHHCLLPLAIQPMVNHRSPLYNAKAYF